MYLTMSFPVIHMNNHGQFIFGDGDVTKALILSTLWPVHEMIPCNTNQYCQKDVTSDSSLFCIINSSFFTVCAKISTVLVTVT